jgi:hypothetical protein
MTNAVSNLGGSNIVNTTTTSVPLTLTGAVSQTADLLDIKNSAGTVVASIDAQGNFAAQNTVYAGKNFLINGGQDFWQRGTSFSGSYTYSSDRWYSDAYNVGGTTSQSTTVPAGYKYSIKMQRPASSTTANAASIGQVLETQSTIPLQGQNVTLSFWAKAGANISNVGFVRLFTGTGTDQSISTAYGSWTNYNEIVTASCTPTTTWQKFTFTGFVATSVTQIGVRVGWITAGTAGADDSLYLTGLQLEVGSVATPFSRAGGTLQGELAAAQRYYFAGQADTRFPSPNASGAWVFPALLPVCMRTTPTYAFTGTATQTNIGSITITAVGTSNNQGRLTISTTSGSNTDTYYVNTFSASAEL